MNGRLLMLYLFCPFILISNTGMAVSISCPEPNEIKVHSSRNNTNKNDKFKSAAAVSKDGIYWSETLHSEITSAMEPASSILITPRSKKTGEQHITCIYPNKLHLTTTVGRDGLPYHGRIFYSKKGGVISCHRGKCEVESIK